jgi:hypothetical protein
MRICLCLREARTSENGPPPLAPAPAATPPPRAFARRRARRRSAGAAWSRSAGRGGPKPRPERVSVPRGLGRRHRRNGPAAAHSRPTTRRADRTDDRASTDARPGLQPLPLPIPRPPYPRLTPRRLDGRPTRLKSDTNPPITPAPARCRRPAPGPPAPAWADPHHIYLARRGRGGPARSGGPPLPPKPRRDAKETPRGGAAARCAQGRNP